MTPEPAPQVPPPNGSSQPVPEKPKQPRPIIIIKKKKGGHAAHHGGAWKVAYADFVTAMMALFIVLWLVNSSPQIQHAVAGYFQDPKGFEKAMMAGRQGTGKQFALTKDDMAQLKQELEKAVQELDVSLDKLKDQIEMTVTQEGLRIELLESKTGMFFELGDDIPTGGGAEMLSLLARELGKLPNKISIEGHTDSKPFAARHGYTNWELSIDRANAARQLMQEKGLRKEQVAQLRGFADQQLRKPDKPYDDSNRRVSVIVQYRDAPPGGGKPAPRPSAH